MSTGWIGRHLQVKATENQSPFRAVGLGAIVQQSLRGPIPTIALQSIADFHLRGEAQQLARIQQTISSLYDGNEFIEIEGQETLAAMDTLAKIANQSIRPRTMRSTQKRILGNRLRPSGQLIKSDLGVEVAAVDMGGWDTHQAQGNADGQMARLMEELAQGLAAFYTDMRDQMKNITLVTMSEFGRRGAREFFERYGSWTRECDVCAGWSCERREGLW